MAVLLVVPVLVRVGDDAGARAVAGTSFMPHCGHVPALSEVTSGCIGQTYEVGAGTSFMPHCGHVPGSVAMTSGCIGQV